jgi:hypothetical protein
MLRQPKRALLMACAILLALLPLIELVDHWENYRSDPEFVSVCTFLGIAFGFVLLLRRAFLSPFSRLLSGRFSFGRSAVAIHFSPDVVPTVSPPIRAPIRI